MNIFDALLYVLFGRKSVLSENLTILIMTRLLIRLKYLLNIKVLDINNFLFLTLHTYIDYLQKLTFFQMQSIYFSSQARTFHQIVNNPF